MGSGCAFAESPAVRYHVRMNSPQKNILIRNIVGGVGLIVIAVFVMAFFGVFESDQSNEAQIRAVIEGVKEEINDHDWEALLALSDSTPEEADIWRRSIPKQADVVVVDSLTPKSFLTVPDNATEFVVDVTAIARMELATVAVGRPVQTEGKLYFVKVSVAGKDVWKLDLKRSAPTFPYLPNPKLPPRTAAPTE